MRRLQRLILKGAAGLFMATLLFPPICEINDRKTAVVQYYFLLSMPPLNSGTTIWPVTPVLLFLEWMLILGVAGVTFWIVGRKK
jgi:hypothetical protein